MRGDFNVCTAPITGDVNGDCRVDLDDLVILIDDWFEDHTAP
jgi:hypothetical protein